MKNFRIMNNVIKVPLLATNDKELNESPITHQELSNGRVAEDCDLMNTYKQIAKIALPAIACQFCVFLQEIINIVFVGRLNDDRKLAGVGLGNAVITSCGISAYYGLNGALSTFVA